uniref:Uncharacterized protein n=1 Tax=Siphoviridae sp. ctHip2 TaxID=2827830 RepID=A0A8S5RV72_9CAUD|nr:MAG TPA: hypothetical protein [Siphoviridae sp. ctHip2]
MNCISPKIIYYLIGLSITLLRNDQFYHFLKLYQHYDKNFILFKVNIKSQLNV